MPTLPTISLSAPDLSSQLLSISALSPARTNANANANTAAHTGAGFFYLADHGIPAALVAQAFGASADFFENESLGAKRATVDRQANTGWTEVGSENLDPSKKSQIDVKESFYVSLSVLDHPPGTDTRSASYTPQHLPPTLSRATNRAALASLMEHCRRVCASLLAAFEAALALPSGTFTEQHRTAEDDRLRLIRYPAQAASSSSDTATGMRAGAHTDYGTLTLLFQRDIGGLQVFDKRGAQWVDVPPPPSPPAVVVHSAHHGDLPPAPPLVVNIGDAMELWTGGLLPSTLHRVVEPRCTREQTTRYSIAFFHHPSPGASLTPLERGAFPPELRQRLPEEEEWRRTCGEKGIPVHPVGGERLTLTGGEYLRMRLDASYKPVEAAAERSAA